MASSLIHPDTSDSVLERDREPDRTSTTDDPQEESEDDQSEPEEYVVEDVLDVRGNKPYEEFLIKWQGYSDSENTWEPFSGVQHIWKVQQFIERKQKEAEVELKRGRKQKEMCLKERKKTAFLDSDALKKSKSKQPDLLPSTQASAIYSLFFPTKPILDIRLNAEKRNKKVHEQEKQQGRTSKKYISKQEHASRARFSSNVSEERRQLDPEKKVKKRRAHSSSSSEDQSKSLKKETSNGNGSSASTDALKKSTNSQPNEPLNFTDLISKEVNDRKDVGERSAPVFMGSPRQQSPEIHRVLLPQDRKALKKTERRLQQEKEERLENIRREHRVKAKTTKWFSPSPSNDSDSNSSLVEYGDTTGLYIVEDCVDMKGARPNRSFLIKWVGYPSEENTWEPESGVAHLEVVERFLRDTAIEQEELKKQRKQLKSTSSLKGKLTVAATSCTRIKIPLVHKQKLMPQKVSSNKSGSLLEKKAGLGSSAASSKRGVMLEKKLVLPPSEPSCSKVGITFEKKESNKSTFVQKPLPKNPVVSQKNISGGTPKFYGFDLQKVLDSMQAKTIKRIVPQTVPSPKSQTNLATSGPSRNFDIDLPDSSIKESRFNDPMLFRLVMRTSYSPPQPPAVLVPTRTILPDNLVPMSAIDNSRFVGFGLRSEYLKGYHRRYESGGPSLVTRPDHLIERVFASKSTVLGVRHARNPEVIVSSSGYFENTLFEKYSTYYSRLLLNPTTDALRDSISPISEIPLMLKSRFRDVDVRAYLSQIHRRHCASKEIQVARRK